MANEVKRMAELIIYLDEELTYIKPTIDRLLGLEKSVWDHENTYEWIIGWSARIEGFINIRREHFGNRGNGKNPIAITITNRLGHSIHVASSVLEWIEHKLVEEFDKVLLVGKLSRSAAHRYVIDADKIIFKKENRIETINNDKNASSWVQFLFWALQNGLRLKSKNFSQYVEVKNLDKMEWYYEIEKLASGDLVMSKFAESDRDIPFDLRGFDESCHHDFEADEEKFIKAVKHQLLKE